MRPDRAVDSIQWIDLPSAPPQDLPALERLYFAWVPRIGGQLAAPDPAAVGSEAPLAIEVQAPGRPPAIRMSAPEEAPGRRARRILGGLLAYPGGELAFELGPPPAAAGVRLTVALRAFRPRMPLPVYLLTQRRLHERSTFAFLREVARTVTGV
ncbi:MAG: hypothetical protein M9894_06915 [Planctomycetes bacterium]|nr:hypothetical protein [Planctomycetota bacterium]